MTSQSLLPNQLSGKGTAVASDFQLPWNTTRSMADVWTGGDGNEKRKQELAALRERSAKRAEVELRRRIDADYLRHSNLPTITASGKVAFAGYDKDDAS